MCLVSLYEHSLEGLRVILHFFIILYCVECLCPSMLDAIEQRQKENNIFIISEEAKMANETEQDINSENGNLISENHPKSTSINVSN